MGSGGGGSTTQTVDPKYNQGMLELSQEQQQWSGEMFNMFKYGVPYDPKEEVGTGNFSKEQRWVDEIRQPGEPTLHGESGAVTGYRPETITPGYYETQKNEIMTTRGEQEGYDPNAQVSEMQYLQNLVESNQELLGARQGAEAADLGLQTGTAESQLRLLAPQEAATLSELLYKKNLADMQGRMLPKQEEAVLSELALKIGMNESQLRLLGPQESASLANLAYQQANSEMNTRLLPAQESATRTGLEYQTGLNTSRSELLPGQTKLAQKGIDFQSSFLDEAGKGVDKKGWMNEAQASVQHSYKLANKANRMDISSYGLDPGAGRYASQNRDKRMREASGVAGARTGAQRAAETEDFRRKSVASSGLKIPTL